MNKFTIVSILSTIVTFLFFSIIVRLIQGLFVLVSSMYPGSLLMGIVIGLYLFIPTRNKIRDSVLKYV